MKTSYLGPSRRVMCKFRRSNKCPSEIRAVACKDCNPRGTRIHGVPRGGRPASSESGDYTSRAIWEGKRRTSSTSIALRTLRGSSCQGREMHLHCAREKTLREKAIQGATLHRQHRA